MGVLGSKQKDTVTNRQCRKDREQGKQICKFSEEDMESGNTVAEAIIEVDLDENGNPRDTHENVKGYEDQKVKELKKKTENIAKENADGGALSGNTEM
mgnify:CR=1 FL=1